MKRCKRKRRRRKEEEELKKRQEMMKRERRRKRGTGRRGEKDVGFPPSLHGQALTRM